MRYLFLLTLLICFTFGSYSQTDYEKKGDGYLKYNNYDRALREYLKVYSKDSENAAVLEKIITCILNDNVLRDRAIPYIEKFASLRPESSIHRYQMALALFHSHRFDEAQACLNQFRTSSSGRKDQEMASDLESQIETARRMIANPANVRMINMGSEINSSQSDINPYVTADGKTLFFSSDERFNSYAGIYYFNIKTSANNGLGWEKSKTLGGVTNTIFDEKTSGYGNATGELFFNHNRNKEEMLASVQHLGQGRMGIANDLGAPFDMKGAEYSATLSITGDTIVFSGIDINNCISLFYSIRMPDNSWGESRLLPGKINSTSDDNYAQYSPDGQRLYFSSNRKGSMGGFDLYYSQYDHATKEWGEAVQLPYPINDTYDNMTISFEKNLRYAYVSTVRPEGFGNKDIYQVVFENSTEPEAVFSCSLMIKGKPADRQLTLMPQFMIFDARDQIASIVSSKTPQSPFIVVLKPGKYKVSITSDEIEPFEVDFDVPETSYDGVASPVTFLLTPKKQSSQ